MVPFPLIIFLFISAVPAQATPVNSRPIHNLLIDKICNQTSNFSSCVDSLYSDPRAPTADQYTLAYIAVGSAYNYALTTRALVSKLLSNATSSERSLRACAGDYSDAVSKLAAAYTDLDSETFFELAPLSAKAAESAARCQKASPSLTARNEVFRGLCEIVGAVGKMFTGGIV